MIDNVSIGTYLDGGSNWIVSWDGKIGRAVPGGGALFRASVPAAREAIAGDM